MTLPVYKEIKLNLIKKYTNNSRKHSEHQVQQVVNSIEEFGFTNPILIDENNQIIAGHCRLDAAKLLKLESVPCIVLSHLTDAQKKAYVIADNKLALNSDWDIGMLQKEFEALKLDEFNLELTGFSLEELIDIFPHEEPEVFCDEDDCPDAPEEPIAKLGEVWLLGEHRLMCGDSTSIDAVDKLMNGVKVDIVFTDPPYNVASDSKNFASDCSKAMNDLSNAEWDKDFDIKPALLNAINASHDSATYYIWSNHFLISDIWNILKEYCDFYSYLVWSKPNPMPSLSKRHPTWNTELCAYGTRGTKRKVNFPKSGHFLSCREVVKKSDGSHPTQKPIELIEPLVEFSSTKGQLVLNLFGGSG